ncbi:hypothetical protein K505DRAFT_155980 [Melanomma pulvis-pyrius CBS 109.77]|uniref:Uncharacterized protein n=1 Tax=Melanomma pulvis-pyrius CBS 109.77 TaxID=1314802 RepID=A0A6A6XK63_9PLEO|nr:hypothetical protein K505DRAFT_155980 [Melanomma pulvis-pyrius CBS 109.77]
MPTPLPRLKQPAPSLHPRLSNLLNPHAHLPLHNAPHEPQLVVQIPHQVPLPLLLPANDGKVPRRRNAQVLFFGDVVHQGRDSRCVGAEGGVC